MPRLFLGFCAYLHIGARYNMLVPLSNDNYIDLFAIGAVMTMSGISSSSGRAINSSKACTSAMISYMVSVIFSPLDNLLGVCYNDTKSADDAFCRGPGSYSFGPLAFFVSQHSYGTYVFMLTPSYPHLLFARLCLILRVSILKARLPHSSGDSPATVSPHRVQPQKRRMISPLSSNCGPIYL